MADGIIFRTTDNLRWGAAGGLGTGGNLTPLQGDENLWELLTRIQALENDPPEAISVDGFTVIGSQFQVNMSDGSTRGPYDLPIATFRLVGEWTNDQPLAQLDMFTVVHRGLYLTLIAHTTPSSPAEFDPDAIDEDSGSPTFGDPLYQLIFGEDVYIYDLGFFYPGQPGQGIQGAMFGHVVARTLQIVTDAEGSQAKLGTQTTAAMSFPIKKNGTTIGTIDFGVADLTGTFTVDETDFAEGDLLQVFPATGGSDATAFDLYVTLRLLRTDI